MIRETPSSEWGELLDRFSDTHRAWLTTLHYVNREGAVARVRSAPLGGVSLEGAIADPVIRVTLDTGRVVCAWRPRAVRVELADNGAERALEIDAGDGAFLRLAFRAAASPETVDGLAPAEVDKIAEISASRR